MQANKVFHLIRKDFRLEWRNKFAIGGVVLYLVSTIFVTYLAFDGRIELQTWNALFWLIILFASMHAIMKGFVQESENRQLYYYVLASGKEVIVSKIIYNSLLMVVLSLTGLLLFIAFMGNPLQSFMVFLINMLPGVVGLAVVLTLVSAIASKAKNNFTLMAVLGFPLVLPLLLLLIRVSNAGLAGAPMAETAPDMLVILLLIFIAFTLSVVLFPYIWRE